MKWKSFLLILLISISFLQAYDFEDQTDFNFEDKGIGDNITINQNITIISGNATANLTNVAFTNQSNSFTGNQSTDSWFNGLFNWTVNFLSNFVTGNFDGNTLTINFNETLLNQTIEDKIVSIEFNATIATTINGVLDGGNVSNTWRRNDGLFYNVSEVSGSPGFLIEFNFTGISNFNNIVSRLDYQGSATHFSEFTILDCNTGLYETEGEQFSDTDGFATFIIEIVDPQDHLCGLDQNVSIRIEHMRFGNPNHDIIIDSINLVKGATVASPTEVDPLSLHREGDVINMGDQDWGGFNLTNVERVGIGTLNPSSALEVNGNLTLSGTTQSWLAGLNDDESMFFQSQNSGNDSIFKLYSKDGDGTDHVLFMINGVGTPDSTDFHRVGVGWSPSGNYYALSSGKGGFETTKEVRIIAGLEDLAQIVAQTDGNVGIGTSTPRAKLNVNGTLLVNGTSISLVDSTNPLFTVIDSTNSVITAINSQDNLGAMGTVSNHNLSFVTNAQIRMTLLNTGQVGIETNDPKGSLHVVGNGVDRFVGLFVQDGAIPDLNPTGLITASNILGIQANGPSYFSGIDLVNGVQFVMGNDLAGKVFMGSMTNNALNFRAGNIVKLEIPYDLRSATVSIMSSGANADTQIIFDGDRNWRIQNDGDGSLGCGVDCLMFRDDGSGKIMMAFDTNGNVGIGAITPDSPLHVNHSTIDYPFKVESGDDKAGIVISDNTYDGFITVKENFIGIGGTADLSTNNLNINLLNGNVGIGTISPDSPFEIKGDSTDMHMRQSDGKYSLGLITTNTGAGRIYLWTDNPDSDTADAKVGILSDGFTYFNGGNVGIGTNSPTSLLSLGADAVISRGTSDGSDNSLLTIAGGGLGSFFRGGRVSVYGNENTDGYGDVIIFAGKGDGSSNLGDILFSTFETSSTESVKMMIRNDGNIGIGTDSPDEKLEVIGNILLSGELMGSRQSIIFSDDAGAGLANNNRYLFAGGVQMTADKGLTAIRDGSIVGISINYDVTGNDDPDTFDLEVLKNGAVVWTNALDKVVANNKEAQATQARGTDTFVAGDTITLRISTTDEEDASMNYNDVIILLEYVYDD